MSSMKRFNRFLPARHLIITALCILLQSVSLAYAQRDSIPPDYPQSLKQDLQHLLKSSKNGADDITTFLQLAETYMNIGDDLLSDLDERIAAYEQGRFYAEQALYLEEANAGAHFLYAANLGNASQLKGHAYGALKINDILKHVRRAVEIKPDHAPALQMLGGLLAELPWFLGGDMNAAQEYLKKAIKSDGNYTNARIILAKLLIKQGKINTAREQLLEVVHAKKPHYPYTWAHRFRPQAQELLASLPQ